MGGRQRRRVVILGAAGRDFHDFNVVYREDPATEVVAFTAAQIPGIDQRVYPPSLAGPHYPDGIPIFPEADLEDLVRCRHADEVVLAYSDLSHEQVMHLGSRALAAGASFSMLAPSTTWLRSIRPVIAVCAVRTGAGKSQTSRYVAGLLTAAGCSVALIRHPMPYGNLEAMRVQRFATIADIDASNPTIEEREEYEEPVRQGVVVYAGVDYAEVLARAEADADVIVWDGGNNDTSFLAPDLQITVADALRPGQVASHHPGELNVRLADIVVVNKTEAAAPDAVEAVTAAVRSLNATAAVVRVASPVALDDGPDLAGRRVLVVEDGPTLTHGGMPSGAGLAAARAAGADIVDPRPSAVGSIRQTYRMYGHIGPVLPAVGYSPDQVAELEATIAGVECDAVVSGTPFDLGRLVSVARPLRRARYRLAEVDRTPLRDILEPYIRRWAPPLSASTPPPALPPRSPRR
ncbi:MAG TPA: hypothetical protein VFH58_15260 [Acidimicrobiales bacterium]|nr:hypothetical protein [Acidimicrobiales bacterium]